MSLESRLYEEVKKIFDIIISVSIEKRVFYFESKPYYIVECMFYGDLGLCRAFYKIPLFDDVKQAAIKLVDDVRNNRHMYYETS